jgi:hypothetical protein
MKKKFTIAFVFLYQIILAQVGLTVQKSEIFQDVKNRSELVFAEEDGHGGLVSVRAFYSGLSANISGYYLEHYDNQLKTLGKIELPHSEYQLKGLKVADGKIYLISVDSDKATKTWKVNLHTSDLNQLNFSQSALITREDIENNNSSFFNFNQKDSDAYNDVKFSRNKNFVCVSFDLKNKEQETHLIYVFDKDFKKTGEYVFTRDIKDRLFELDNIEVDDASGGVSLLAKVFENDSRMTKKENKSNYHYEIYYMLDDEKKELSFKSEDKFIGSLKSLGDEKLSYIGFYSEMNDWRYKGVCRFEIDPETLEITSKTFAPFTEQFIIDKYGEEKKKELKNLIYRSAFKLKNGDIILNAEEFFITTTYSSFGGVGTTAQINHYNDIVSLRIKEDGTLVWARNINKKQTFDSGKESFSSFMSHDENYIFINASDQVRQLSNNRPFFKQERGNATNMYVIILDADGNLKFQRIIDGDVEQMPYAVARGVLTAKGDGLILIGRNFKNKQLIKISATD